MKTLIGISVGLVFVTNCSRKETGLEAFDGDPEATRASEINQQDARGKGENELSLIMKNTGNELVISRSRRLEVVTHVVFIKDGKQIWRFKYGARDFMTIDYGVLPRFSDSKMNPIQLFPPAGKPVPLRAGDRISVGFEYSDDKLPLSPSTSSEVWSIEVPNAGEMMLGELQKK